MVGGGLIRRELPHGGGCEAVAGGCAAAVWRPVDLVTWIWIQRAGQARRRLAGGEGQRSWAARCARTGCVVVRGCSLAGVGCYLAPISAFPELTRPTGVRGHDQGVGGGCRRQSLTTVLVGCGWRQGLECRWQPTTT